MLLRNGFAGDILVVAAGRIPLTFFSGVKLSKLAENKDWPVEILFEPFDVGQLNVELVLLAKFNPNPFNCDSKDRLLIELFVVDENRSVEVRLDVQLVTAGVFRKGLVDAGMEFVRLTFVIGAWLKAKKGCWLSWLLVDCCWQLLKFATKPLLLITLFVVDEKRLFVSNELFVPFVDIIPKLLKPLTNELVVVATFIGWRGVEPVKLNKLFCTWFKLLLSYSFKMLSLSNFFCSGAFWLKKSSSSFVLPATVVLVSWWIVTKLSDLFGFMLFVFTGAQLTNASNPSSVTLLFSDPVVKPSKSVLGSLMPPLLFKTFSAFIVVPAGLEWGLGTGLVY